MQEEKVYTVSELTKVIKNLLEENFPGVWVEGEISNLSQSPSKHFYFTLKDEGAQLEAVLFWGRSRPFRSFLKDGTKVRCYGTLTVYAPKGKYQLEVLLMEERGLGALHRAFEELKKRLYAEGLFDEKFKKPLPLLPRKIGVVTSPRGAAIRDILNIIKRRFARVHVIIYPARVQGEGAAFEIEEGIRFFNHTKMVDVIIVARGGGSIEDLWAFNEENVARAIFESEIPVISAVGHQVDYTIADFVADTRAPTPSAAAEIVVQREDELREKLSIFRTRLANVVTGKISGSKKEFASLKRRLELRDPRRIVRDSIKRLDDLHMRLLRISRLSIERRKRETEFLKKRLLSVSPEVFIEGYKKQLEGFKKRLCKGIELKLSEVKNSLSLFKGKLEGLSPKAPLSRGYSICYDEVGRVIKDAYSISEGSRIKVELYRGALICRVEKKQIL